MPNLREWPASSAHAYGYRAYFYTTTCCILTGIVLLCHSRQLLAPLIRDFLRIMQSSKVLGSLTLTPGCSCHTSLTLLLSVLLLLFSTSKVRAYGSQSGDILVPFRTALFGLGSKTDSTLLNGLFLHTHQV